MLILQLQYLLQLQVIAVSAQVAYDLLSVRKRQFSFISVLAQLMVNLSLTAALEKETFCR